MTSIVFESIGTKWQIDLEDKIEKEKVKILETQIFDFLEDFDKTYSRFRNDSKILELSKKSGSITLPQSSKEIFEIYKKLYLLTNGLFTPLVGNLLEDAGYDKNYSFKAKKIKDVVPWEKTIEFKYPILTSKKAVILDFGGVGKGYAIDEIAKILKKNRIKHFVIDGGGDIFVRSKKPAVIGLENPQNEKEVIGTIKVLDKSICASAQNRRKWGKFSHIFDPVKKSSPKNILSTWVISKSALVADSLATCLFLTDPEHLKKEFDFEYLILYADYRISKSKNFKAELFYQ